MIYVLDPDLSGAATGREFLQLALGGLGIAQACWVGEASAARVARSLDGSDAVVFCNPPPGGPLVRNFRRILTAAQNVRAVILPVAASPDARLPPAPAHTLQSWDVCEFAALRNHLSDNLEPAVDEFVRLALAQVEPTCFTRHPTFFIAHRRLDGEDLVRRLDSELRRRGHPVFRDLLDVTVGSDAQAEIEQRLADSDALVFVDTPAVGDSRAATNELRTALEHRVPVVWVKVGDAAAERAPLAVLPGGTPDIEVSGDVDDLDAAALADQVIACYQTTTARMVTEANELMDDLTALDGRDGIRIERLDGIPAGFRLVRPRNTLGLPERPLVHLCQLYGRRVTHDDARLLRDQLVAGGLLGSRYTVDVCDAVILLDPRPRTTTVDGSVVTLSGRDYLATVGGLPPDDDPRSQLLISGSWTDIGAADSEVLRAVADLAEEWLRLGGGVVFGGHPTFTPVIVGAARRVSPTSPQGRLSMVQSEHFATIEYAEAAALHATVIATRDEGDRARSLSLMRTRMIQQPNVVAVVAVGGRADGHGVDEEIALARGQHIPFVPMVAPGGRAAAIAADLDDRKGWSASALPPLTGAEMRSFSHRTDYRGVARDLYTLLS